MIAIESQKLRKSYGDYKALHGIDLTVPTGSLFGFLGPNGAGKTTAIRILLGLLRATDGVARILDQDPWRDGPSLRAHIGYIPGDIRLYPNMTGRDTLCFFDRARRRNSSDEIDRLSTAFDLDLGKRVRAYSKGMKQKLGLIQALMHRPQLLILDEPSSGLDPLVQATLQSELRSAATRGQTVLFSSHTLKEVQDLCDRVAILRNGNLIEQDAIDTLRNRAIRRVEITFDGNGSIPDKLIDGFTVINRTDRQLAGSWTGPLPRLMHWLANQPIADVTIAPPDLEDLFMTYYADDGAEKTA